MVVLPSALEMALKAFLAEKLTGQSATAGDGGSDGGANGDAGAYYHTALDTGLAPEATPNHFAVLSDTSGTDNDGPDGTAATSMDAAAGPLYAEPNWQTIGVSLYADPGPALEYVVLALGLGVCVASAVLARAAKARLADAVAAAEEEEERSCRVEEEHYTHAGRGYKGDSAEGFE